jgi:hypothetical protein
MAVAVAFLLLIAPVSFAYDRRYRSVVRQYRALRTACGATDQPWSRVARMTRMYLNPVLVLAAALLAGLLAVYGAVDEFLRTDPFGALPGFVPEPRHPALVPAVAAAVALAAGLALAGVVGLKSPWWPIQMRLRRAVSARGDRRTKLLAEALASDPSLPDDGSVS